MSDAEPLKVLGISGSLRAGSFNTKALRAAQALAPGEMTLELWDLAEIPPYNNDVYEAGMPAPVAAFRDALTAADALLIATPEYNYSVSGVLKNAIDWGSRPPDQPFDGKPIALMGASMGKIGTARAQYHLRQTFVFLNGFVMNRPEVMISAAHEQFDAEGRLVDETTRGLVRDLLVALVSWTRRIRAGSSDA